jgi:hypothetical protein
LRQIGSTSPVRRLTYRARLMQIKGIAISA